MDHDTLFAHQRFWVQATPGKTAELPNLSSEELKLYDYLNDSQTRLEQGRISVMIVRRTFDEPED